MFHFAILAAVLLGVAAWLMKPEERARVRERIISVAAPLLRRACAEATLESVAGEPYCVSLRARTGRVFVTPALCAANTVLFMLMLAGRGSFSDPATLIGWGGNAWPRTINGEPWRLLTALFVHPGPGALVMSLLGLLQVGLLTERLLGPVAFTALYFTAGISAGLVGAAIAPDQIHAGGSSALLAVYACFAVLSVRDRLQRSGPAISLKVALRIAPAALVYFLYCAATGRLSTAAAWAGMLVGIGGALFTARGTAAQKPAVTRVVGSAVAGLGAAAVLAVLVYRPPATPPDVRPEIQRVIAMESRTARAYESAVLRFKKGRMTAASLAGLIDEAIVPELEWASARLRKIDQVPQEQQPLVARTEDYLTLRAASWRARSKALHTSNLSGLQDADRQERVSLQTFQDVLSRNRSAN